MKGARTVAEMWPCESSEEAISEYIWPQIHGNPRIKGVIERSCGLVPYVKFRIPELARSLCSGRYSVRFSGNPKVWKWHWTGPTMKYDSICGMELAWAYAMQAIWKLGVLMSQTWHTEVYALLIFVLIWFSVCTFFLLGIMKHVTYLRYEAKF